MPERIVARLRLEKSGRGGKSVTVIDGLPQNRDFLRGLATELKKACGAGGTAADGAVEIQGDRRETLNTFGGRRANEGYRYGSLGITTRF